MNWPRRNSSFWSGCTAGYIGVFMCKYNDEYVAELESVAEEMIISMENMLSLVDPKRTPLCGNLGAANQAALLIDEYHKVKRDFSID
jgi:hypothetical protein